ncbi:zinc-binding dehydrogenase [Cellulomonas cellasea]|uniref:zinc-dependent alcohol dehydrogenase n=1 Tax=Cellulomonas cellasea TaxID=43670 RepID=UPI0025A40543|nr:zinc-binding dehydrogenase [Cellulomonas cellasea]MDM8084017.1 zinc-binding dehydrogenase [Cellulomonas cellasea]
MKVARLHGVGDIRLTDEPDPVPSAGESLVRVTAVGLCGSDLHWFTDGGIGDAGLTSPLVLGHEMAGVVVGGPDDGQRVAIDPADPCGVCEHCLEGNRNLCPTVRFAGHGKTDGGLRELMAWPSHLLHPVPDTLSAADTAVLEPLGVALHAMDLGKPRLGATVVVVGCGPIGLCLVQLARVAGAGRVIAVEPLAHRRAAADALGADESLDPRDPQILDLVSAATGGGGAHLVIEAAGTDEAVDLAMHAARPGARVVLAGIPSEDSTTFPASVARRKGLTILMSRRMKEMYPRTIALVERGLVDVASLVSHTYALADAAEAFRVADDRTGLKVVVEPTGDVATA